MKIPQSVIDSIADLGVIDTNITTTELEELLSRVYEDDTCFNHARERTNLSVEDLCKEIDREKALQDKLDESAEIQFQPPIEDQDECITQCVNDLISLNEELSAVDYEAILQLIPEKESVLHGLKVLVQFYLRTARSRLSIRLASRFKRRLISRLDEIILDIQNLSTNDSRARYEIDFALALLNEQRRIISRTGSTGEINLIASITSVSSSHARAAANAANSLMGRDYFTSRRRTFNIVDSNRPESFESTFRNSGVGRYLRSLQENINSRVQRRFKLDESITFLDDVKETDISLRQTWIEPRIGTNDNLNRHAYRLALRLVSIENGDINSTNPLNTDLLNSIIDVLNRYYDQLEEIVNDYNTTDRDAITQDIIQRVGQVECCGEKLENSLPDSINPNDFSNIEDQAPDLSWNTFDIDNKPTITDIEYWREYSKYLNLVGLIPKYWPIGIIIAGVRVPLPIIWIPLFVLVSPLGIIVFWLTINGIVICPTVWLYRFPDNTTVHLTLFKGANQTIKPNSGTAILNPPVIDGINSNLELTRSLPIGQDDLPTVRRMGLANIPYISYLDQWLSTAKPLMGL